MTLARKIVKRDDNGPTTKPITNISFISAPPKVSFLKMKLPRYINRYMNPNISMPLNKLIIVGINPVKMNDRITNEMLIKMVISSGIIK